MAPRGETVFCEKCKPDKLLAQFSKAQRQEKNCSRRQGEATGGAVEDESAGGPTSIFMIISLSLFYKHISVDVGYKTMSLIYVI